MQVLILKFGSSGPISLSPNDDDYSDHVDNDRHGDHDSLISLHYPPGAQGNPLGMQSLLQEDPPGQPLSPPCPHPQRHGP